MSFWELFVCASGAVGAVMLWVAIDSRLQPAPPEKHKKHEEEEEEEEEEHKEDSHHE